MTTTRIRGVVQPGGGASSAGGGAWNRSFTLRPWRTPEGVLQDGLARVWSFCEDTAARDRARAAEPRPDQLVEIEVETPERIRGLESRERLPFEFELLHWRAVDDEEIAARAVEIALPKRIEDPELGSFALREPTTLNWYEAKRPRSQKNPKKTYRLVVDVTGVTSPAARIEQAKAVATWVEPAFPSIVRAAGERMFETWNDSWRQDDDDEEDLVDAGAFSARLTVESVFWSASDDTDSVRVGLDDHHLFGGHGIDVFLADRKVVRAKLG